MAELNLMPHEVDRHLVAALIALSKIRKELAQVPRWMVEDNDPDRRDRFEAVVAMADLLETALDEVRVGYRREKRPKTIDEVADIDRYRRDFIEPMRQTWPKKLRGAAASRLRAPMDPAEQAREAGS